ARAENLGVTFEELAVLLSELRDLGRADEGEVHRPEEDDLPLAREVLVGDVLELLALLQAHRRLEVERGKLVSNGQHRLSRSFVVFGNWLARGARRGSPTRSLMRCAKLNRKQIIYLYAQCVPSLTEICVRRRPTEASKPPALRCRPR